jgi:hypothetical protein
MLNRLSSSWSLFTDSFRVFGKYPVLIVPIVFSWLLYAPIVLWAQFFAPWDSLSAGQIFLVVFLIGWAFALLLSLSCAWLLELVQQIESGEPASLGTAWRELVSKDLRAIIPLSLVWAVLWFILTVLEAIFSRRNRDSSQDLNAQSAAEALGGDGPFSWLRLGFQMLQKVVRMVMFLILPAVAWEDKGFGDATRRGLSVLRQTLVQFFAGYALTEAAAAIIFIPPAIMFELADKQHVAFPTWAWYLCILYVAFATSYSIYLEQMYTAELFMWFLLWERAKADAIAKGAPAPALTDVPRPQVIDGTPDLISMPSTTMAQPPAPPAPPAAA